MSRTVVITGGAGFIGANLVRRLLAEGDDVHVLSRPGSDTWRLNDIARSISIVDADVRDRERVARAVARAKPDWLFHLAAHGNSASETSARDINDVVFGGTVNVIDACAAAGCDVVVNAGSSSEYGFKDHAPSENEPLDPNSCYAVAKAAATMFARHSARERRSKIVTLRLYSVFGPWEEPARLIPTIIAGGLGGEWPPLVGPDVARDFVYVDDVVDALLLAAHAAEPGAVFNVGTGTQTTVGDVVDLAARALGIGRRPEWGTMPNRMWDSSIWVADPSSIGRSLGWRPRHTFEEGFRLFVNWLESDPAILARYRRAQAAARQPRSVSEKLEHAPGRPASPAERE